jgi:hypothetical protein
MKYHFQDLLNKHQSNQALINKMLSVGELTEHRTKITLPDDFVFEAVNVSTLNHSPATNSDWPLPVQPLKLLAKAGDTGLGDIVEREIGPINSDVFKTWFQSVFQRQCKCTWNKSEINRKYPLESKSFKPAS